MDGPAPGSARTAGLLIPYPRSSTAVLLAEAAARRGLPVLERVPERGPGARGDLHWYGGPLAADRVAVPAGIALLEPADTWLAALSYELTHRRIQSTTLGEARALRRPAFVKPPSDKSLPAAVYADGSRLPPPNASARITDDATVLVSEVVEFAAEYRCFVRDGRVVTGGRYAVRGLLDPGPLASGARAFAERVVARCAGAGPGLPGAVVLDVGPLTGGRWAVVEANMAWYAHCYTADPERVLDVVLAATGPHHAVTPTDRPFLRPLRPGQPPSAPPRL
ncbi:MULTISPECIES: ATP-grasp domain-containing protein [Streptomyces]|uniref:ATP-grasp domain-containing protein n=1 Tax=Streptomyces TaxID=1883 RepID=UPI001E601D62|nr:MULTISPECIES: ATP-grasp domain-containing protein [Streptomyces]UFQ16985.1 ATP-grasp domain-containing protein [Streptomyces huasconensis]WCL86587.1 ATP-grasp domain-containing protein [Streptomyces sp. JCM 35825]